MKITTKHASSSYGLPVILDDSGRVMDYVPGLKAVAQKLGLAGARDIATLCGVSINTVYGWQAGKPIAAAPLNALGDALERLTG
jgi:hypothetical protein